MSITLTIKSKQNVLVAQLGRKQFLTKIVKLAKMANVSVESGSESGSSFIGPLQEKECFINITSHEILLKTHCSIKFETILTYWTSFRATKGSWT